MNPRSLKEIEFAASLRPCAACGDRAPLRWHSSGGSGAWRTHAVCPCGELRMHAYSCDLDLRAVEPKHHELGGKDPSTIIEPGELIAEIERIAPAISSTDTGSDGWKRVHRVLTALNELRKLVRGDRARAKWAREQHARYSEILQQLLDAERAARGGARLVAGPYTPPPTIDREARRAHVEWLRRGRTGTGRIEVVGARTVAERFSAEDVTAARFERTEFGPDVSYTKFDEAELVDCVLERAFVTSAHFAGATLTGCSLDRAHGQFLDFSRTRIDRCSFDDAVLTETHWDHAIATATSFAGTTFAASCWERATFRRCSFRGASWEPRQSYPHERMIGARFEDCDFRDACFANADLRGATFVRCQFAGAHGEPRATDGMVVAGGEVSLEELLRELPRVYTVAELAARASSIVVAADRAAGKAAPLVVFAREGTNVRRIGIVRVGGTELAARRIASSVTYGACGFVWAADEKCFRIWGREQSRVEITREALLWTGSIPTAAITAVVSVAEPSGARCGVAIRTPSLSPRRSILVQNEDERRWTIQLARELADWLHVPYIDGGEPADRWT